MAQKRFAGKVAIVTGGAQGLGRAQAELFAREGAHVVIVDRRGAEVHDTGAALQSASPEVKILVAEADVGDDPAVKSVVDTTVHHLGRVDILVNNAGDYLAKSVQSTTATEFDRLIATNVKGPFLCCKHVVPHMLAAGKGAIVNIASMGGVVAMEGSPVYSASKSALIGFTRALGLDLAASGIRVNAVAPGWCDTPMTAPLLEDRYASTAIMADIPIKRFSTPEEQAYLVAWLASDEAAYVVGQTFVADGGWTLR